MSRFNNLEFGGQFGDQSVSGPVQKDEKFYLAEALAAFQRGRFEQALRSYARVLEHNPRNPSAWAGQARMLIELGDFEEAKLWADKGLEIVPEDSELLAVKAVALARCGDLKAALMFSDAAIEARGDTPYVWLARGDVLLARKEKRAESCFEKALSMAGGDWFLHWLASRIFAFYRQFSRALKLAQQALALDAAQAVVWLQFGTCQWELGLASAAANSFSQARQLDPECQPPAELRSKMGRAGLWYRVTGLVRQLFQA